MVAVGALTWLAGGTDSEYRRIVVVWKRVVSRISAACDRIELNWEAYRGPVARVDADAARRPVDSPQAALAVAGWDRDWSACAGAEDR